MTSWAVSPALPLGVSLDTSTGVISGKPYSLKAAANYTVTASNSSGSTTAVLTLAVVRQAPVLTYTPAAVTLRVGAPMIPIFATVSGGALTSLSISPPLPDGVILYGGPNAQIYGIPTTASPRTTYTVTAANDGGTSTATVTLTVAPVSTPTVLLDLGHANIVRFMRMTATRLLTQDDDAHWVLWNFATGAIVAQGDATRCQSPECIALDQYPVDLAGDTLVIGQLSGVEIRSAVDGHVIATVDSPEMKDWKLSADGSYVLTSNIRALNVWATADGSKLFTRTGDYSFAQYYPAAGELRVAKGAAGSNVIENFAVPGGVSTLSTPFSGTFFRWFEDGERFFTSLSSTYRVYTKAAVQEDIFSQANIFETLRGSNNWLWYRSGSDAKFFAIGGTAGAPALSIPNPGTLVTTTTPTSLVQVKGNGVDFIDLTGGSLALAHQSAGSFNMAGFAAFSPAQWAVGNGNGRIADGTSLATTPRYLSLGKATSIAGGTQHFAVGLSIGEIRYFSSSSLTLEGAIPAEDSVLRSSGDGSVLGVQSTDDPTLRFLSLPSEALLTSYPYTQGAPPYLSDFLISQAGDLVGRVEGGARRIVTGLLGTPTIFTDIVPPQTDPFATWPLPQIRLSPDSTLIGAPGRELDSNAATNVYKNGILTTAVPGWAVGWIDNNRLLTNSYPRMGNSWRYSGATIYSDTGASIVTLPLPELRSLQTVSANSIYSPQRNMIFSLEDGGSLWTSSNRPRGFGTLIGPNKIVFASGSKILVESY